MTTVIIQGMGISTRTSRDMCAPEVHSAVLACSRELREGIQIQGKHSGGAPNLVLDYWWSELISEQDGAAF